MPPPPALVTTALASGTPVEVVAVPVSDVPPRFRSAPPSTKTSVNRLAAASALITETSAMPAPEPPPVSATACAVVSEALRVTLPENRSVSLPT